MCVYVCLCVYIYGGGGREVDKLRGEVRMGGGGRGEGLRGAHSIVENIVLQAASLITMRL